MIGRLKDTATARVESIVRTCRICGNAEANRLHIAREMMFGTRQAFEYLECGRCGCVQIGDVPAELGQFYPSDYYSFVPSDGAGPRRYLRRARTLQTLGQGSLLGRVLVALFGEAASVESLKAVGLARDTSILDVGCGQGALIRELYDCGFRDLTGVDPWVDREIVHGPGCRVLKQALEETRGRFDLVMMHHSFEHMTEPRAVLAAVVRLLAPEGTVLIRVPLAGSFAWREYGVDWVQLDPPRHLYLHTERSFVRLAREAGLALQRTVFDSTAFQFWGSEQYRAGIPLRDARSHAVDPSRSIFSPAALARFAREARRLNAAGEGDQACFYLRRSAG
jgi:SAM-dependent methyltransferase